MDEDLSQWRDELQQVIEPHGGPLKRVVFLRATDSTQDAARRMHAQAGDVVIAARQTAGRGRLGRAWADTHDDGIAMTMVVPHERGGRLAIAGAVAAAAAAESLLNSTVGIKWPNDVMADGRKLAGVLVEQVNEQALVGIGLNVLQLRWEEQLAARAVSLRQLGATCDRLTAAKALIAAANASLAMSPEQLSAEYCSRDALVGTRATFAVPGSTIHGVVRRIDPLRGLLVQAGEGELWLDAATTSLAVG